MFLSEFNKTLSKIDLLSLYSISLDSISTMVSNTEASIKVELASILNLVLRLPTNARPGHVSQGGDK